VTLADAFREYDASVRGALQRRFPGTAPELVEDAVADAWLICANRWDSVDVETVGGYVFTVARHELGRLVAKRARQMPSSDETLERLAAGESVGGDEHIERLDVSARAQRILAVLRPREQRVMVGRAIGLTYDEIAAATGTTYTNVNKHLSSGRERARAAGA
jgi:RNA polymerase sigma factor (sigma-70 family)